MEIGDYLRTKTGIHKIFRINYSATVWKYHCDKKPTGEWDSSYEYVRVCDYDVIGSSKDIIDLIEPMDLMYIDISPDDCGGIIVPRIAETVNELAIIKEKLKRGEYILKGVVTHEQLSKGAFWL